MSLAVSSTTRIASMQAATPTEVTTAAPSLLPSAHELSSPGVALGATEQLYAMLGQLRDAQLAIGESQARNNHMKAEVARKEREEALHRAEQAAHKKGLVDWIAKDIGVAGVVGLCTFNYALVAADVAAHKTHAVENVKIDVVDVAAVSAAASGYVGVLATDMLLRKTDLLPAKAREVLASCGIPKDAPGISDEDVKPVAKKVLVASIVATSIAATALSGGTAAGITIALAGLALSASGGYVAENGTLDGTFGRGSSRWIGLGMEVTGAAAAAGGGMIAGKAVVSGGAAFASAVNGSRSVALGTDQVLSAVHRSESDRATIEAEEWKQRLAQLDRFVDRILEGAKASNESANRAEKSLRSTLETQSETHVLLAQGIRA